MSPHNQKYIPSGLSGKPLPVRLRNKPVENWTQEDWIALEKWDGETALRFAAGVELGKRLYLRQKNVYV